MTLSKPGPQPLAAGGRTTRLSREILVLSAVVILGTIMTVLDLTIVTSRSPRWSGTCTSISVQWVPTGYLLAFARVIPLRGGRPGGSAPGGSGWPRWPCSWPGRWPPGVVDGRVDRFPGAAGARRRDDPAGRADDPGPGRGPAADGPGDERLGVPLLLGPVFGPVIGGAIVGAPAAVDLLRQPAGGRGRCWPLAAWRTSGRPGPAPRQGWTCPGWRCCPGASPSSSTGWPRRARTAASAAGHGSGRAGRSGADRAVHLARGAAGPAALIDLSLVRRRGSPPRPRSTCCCRWRCSAR